jgi:U3 small nucleolar RNA-associated protein 13
VEDEKRAIETETIVLDQKLANHLRYKEYGKALEIALQVEKPMQVLKVITLIIENDVKKNKGTGLAALQAHAKGWEMERVAQILKYCRDWNTRAKNATVAMVVVKAVVTSIPVDKLANVNGVPEILAGITPYAERHFDRLDRMHTSTYLLDFTLSCLGSLDPAGTLTSEQEFASWEASSKLVLPPKFVDGRIQVGGKAVIGKAKVSDASSQSGEDDDEVVSIGDSSTGDSSPDDGDEKDDDDEEMEDADQDDSSDDDDESS